MRRWAAGVWAAAALSFAGCGDESAPLVAPPPPPPPHVAPPPTLVAGELTLRVDAGARDIALLHGDTVLLHFPADGLELGALPALDDTVNYDPYPLVVPQGLHPPPSGLTWLAPETVTVGSTTPTAITVALSYPQGKSAKLVLEATRPGSFRATLTPGVHGPPIAYFRLRPRADASEGFYGLGESFDEVNQRGKVRAMQLELTSTYESSNNNAHVPIPFILGTRGWGLFVESPFPGVFSVATEKADLVEATFGTGTRSGDGLVFHLFGEAHPLDLIRHYYEVTGFPRLPARWALGPWVWRHVQDTAQAQGDLSTMRDLDLPTTGYWFDDGYFTAVGSFDWHPAKFEAPEALIAQAHALGFAVAIWHVPYIDQTAAATAALDAKAKASGFYPPVAGIPLNSWGTLMDLTNPGARAFWQQNLSAYTNMGVDGFKLDYGEDVVPGLTTGRNVWEFWDGSDERTMHARYQLFYHSTYAEMLPEGERFLLCRHATYGDQTNGLVMWPGDLDASFARNGDPTTDGSSEYVGGLPASVVAGLSLGASGLPFYGADTGGYLHSPADKELFTRWFEQTALSTVMQMGNAANTVAWEPDATTGYDAEMLGWYRTYTRLHLRLFPYVWTYAENLATDGRPIARAFGLAYPELGVHPSDEYLLGDSLLVAPVMERGATSRSVQLPPGRWVDWWTGAVHGGGATITADAPLGTLPLYLREGGIVPMLRPTIATLQATTQPAAVDSYATTPGVLWVRVAPGAPSSFTVFDGALLAQGRQGGAITLTSSDGTEFTSGVMFEVVAPGSKPSHVSDQGAALVDQGTLDALEAAPSGWAYTADTGGTVWVKTGPGSHQIEISP